MPYYSADKGDRGRVLLDGVEQDYVVECNTDEGWLVKYSDPPQLDEDKKLILYRMEGRVEFVSTEEE